MILARHRHTGTRRARRSAFTLLELILVLTILVSVIGMAAPSLSGFFRGRALDAEARRLLALTRAGRSRAISEGIPMLLWVDARQGAYGLEADRSYELSDPRAVTFPLAPDIQITAAGGGTRTSVSGTGSLSSAGALPASSTPNNDLPSIRFLPDGSTDTASPSVIALQGADGQTMHVTPARNRLSHEIRHPNLENARAAR